MAKLVGRKADVWQLEPEGFVKPNAPAGNQGRVGGHASSTQAGKPVPLLQLGT